MGGTLLGDGSLFGLLVSDVDGTRFGVSDEETVRWVRGEVEGRLLGLLGTGVDGNRFDGEMMGRVDDNTGLLGLISVCRDGMRLGINDGGLRGRVDGNADDGNTDGSLLGLLDGDKDGERLGISDGEIDGELEGNAVGILLGLSDGTIEGKWLGLNNGAIEGRLEGKAFGCLLGLWDGAIDDVWLGVNDGEMDELNVDEICLTFNKEIKLVFEATVGSEVCKTLGAAVALFSINMSG